MKYADIFNWYYRDPTGFRIKACQQTIDDYKTGKRPNDVYTQTHRKALPLLINQRDTIQEALTYFTQEEQDIIAETYGRTTKSTNTPLVIASQFNTSKREVRNILTRFTNKYSRLGGNAITQNEMMKPILIAEKESTHEHKSN